MTLEGRFTFKHESPATPSDNPATPTSPFVSEPATSMAAITPTSFASHGFHQQHNSFMSSFPKKEFVATPSHSVGGAGVPTDFYQPPPGSNFPPFAPSGGADFGGEAPPRNMYDHSDGGHPSASSLPHPLALSTMRTIRRGPFASQNSPSQDLSRYGWFIISDFYVMFTSETSFFLTEFIQ